MKNTILIYLCCTFIAFAWTGVAVVNAEGDTLDSIVVSDGQHSVFKPPCLLAVENNIIVESGGLLEIHTSRLSVGGDILVKRGGKIALVGAKLHIEGIFRIAGDLSCRSVEQTSDESSTPSLFVLSEGSSMELYNCAFRLSKPGALISGQSKSVKIADSVFPVFGNGLLLDVDCMKVHILRSIVRSSAKQPDDRQLQHNERTAFMVIRGGNVEIDDVSFELDNVASELVWTDRCGNVDITNCVFSVGLGHQSRKGVCIRLTETGHVKISRNVFSAVRTSSTVVAKTFREAEIKGNVFAGVSADELISLWGESASISDNRFSRNILKILLTAKTVRTRFTRNSVSHCVLDRMLLLFSENAVIEGNLIEANQGQRNVNRKRPYLLGQNEEVNSSIDCLMLIHTMGSEPTLSYSGNHLLNNELIECYIHLVRITHLMDLFDDFSQNKHEGNDFGLLINYEWMKKRDGDPYKVKDNLEARAKELRKMLQAHNAVQKAIRISKFSLLK